MRRLSNATLRDLPAEVATPAYDRSAVTPGIVHLGLGAFHRAHQAVATEAVLAAGDGRWGIRAASLRAPDTRDALAPQDGLYTVAVRDAAGERLQVVGAVGEIIVAPEAPERLLDALGHPATQVVTTTITEKGYCHDPATGSLNEAHPDIVADLAAPHAPRSAVGILVEAIRRRRATGTPPFTLLPCDNLPSNGRVVKRVVARFAALTDPDLGRFVEDGLACPSTMVDRIVPATTDEDRARISARIELTDAWPVVTEPFTQWVIEDAFAGPRPDWSIGGATFVADVAPYELAKLRLLNGAHSSLAYLGYLSGRETVADAMADPALAALAERVMRDAAETLAPTAGLDLDGYRRSLIARFRNPALRHRTWQIAMDGSQKLPQRLLGVVRERLARGAPIGPHALAIAGWIRYVTGTDEQGRPIDVRDPLADRLRDMTAEGAGDPAATVRAFLRFAPVFGQDLGADPRFATAIETALASLVANGAAETVRRAVG